MEEKKKEGFRRETQVDINRKLPNGQIQCYKVIDNPRTLTKDEWENRVVAVIVSGQTWQFKGWVYDNPVQLFQLVVGVHLMLEGRIPDPNVQTWNCKTIKVNNNIIFENQNFLFLIVCSRLINLNDIMMQELLTNFGHLSINLYS